MSDPYEEPLAAELTLETESESPEESARGSLSMWRLV